MDQAGTHRGSGAVVAARKAQWPDLLAGLNALYLLATYGLQPLLPLDNTGVWPEYVWWGITFAGTAMAAVSVWGRPRRRWLRVMALLQLALWALLLVFATYLVCGGPVD